MAALAAIVFILSLVGIALLFALKYREESAGRILMPEAIREVGDERALAFKDFLAQCRTEASQWAPRLARASRLAMHDAALGVAAFARYLESQSHRLADRISHKHRFERRETSNDFLKQVMCQELSKHVACQ
jgi:hypothetical protein